MNQFTEDSQVCIDIPDTTDHDRDRGIGGTIQQVRTVFKGLAAEYAGEIGVSTRV